MASKSSSPDKASRTAAMSPLASPDNCSNLARRSPSVKPSATCAASGRSDRRCCCCCCWCCEASSVAAAAAAAELAAEGFATPVLATSSKLHGRIALAAPSAVTTLHRCDSSSKLSNVTTVPFKSAAPRSACTLARHPGLNGEACRASNSAANNSSAFPWWINHRPASSIRPLQRRSACLAATAEKPISQRLATFRSSSSLPADELDVTPVKPSPPKPAFESVADNRSEDEAADALALSITLEPSSWAQSFFLLASSWAQSFFFLACSLAC
mmetsp:Transcript_99190/g.259200  ORF Transcript_99190/g.259200 Transcript_99190/m.259200 type:complete len:271 (-) Transcript_99190:15-827(-)